MLASRFALRATRKVRFQPLLRTARRHESTGGQSTHGRPSQNHTNAGIVGGLVGAGAVAILGYGYYRYSGAHTVVSTAHAAKSRFEEGFSKSLGQGPEPHQAIHWLRERANSYAGFVPGAKDYVDKAFAELEGVTEKHEKEVEEIVNDAYNKLKDISKERWSWDTVTKVWDTVQTAMKRIKDLAGDAAGDVLNNNPELMNKFGGNLDQLKDMGNQFGPEAKKIVDETWDQIKDVLKGGMSIGTADQLRKLIQDKTQEVRKMGDQAWQKGLEQLKPYLDKSPKLKELLEQNKDKLLQGNLTDLWEKVRSAASSGNTDDLEKYVKESVDSVKNKAGGSFGGLEQYFGMVPGGTEIIPKFQQLKDVAEQHGDEASKLIKDTYKEIGDVLNKRVEEAKKLADKTR